MSTSKMKGLFMITLGLVLIILALIVFGIIGKAKNNAGVAAEKNLVLNPPSKEAIAKRALCLAALVMRGEFELVVQDTPKKMKLDKEAAAVLKKMHEEMTADLQKWLANEKLIEFQSNEEKELFLKPLGSWNQQDMINVSWRVQSLRVMLWALSEEDSIPPYDEEEVEQASLINKVGFLKPTADFISRVRLRPQEQIDKARDIAELWHWRARTTQLINEKQLKPEEDVGAGLNLTQVIKMTSEKGYEEGELPKPIGDDFPMFGKAYKDISDEEYSIAASIAMERHFALNWLCGYSADWDETPTDT